MRAQPRMDNRTNTRFQVRRLLRGVLPLQQVPDSALPSEREIATFQVAQAIPMRPRPAVRCGLYVRIRWRPDGYGKSCVALRVLPLSAEQEDCGKSTRGKRREAIVTTGPILDRLYCSKERDRKDQTVDGEVRPLTRRA